MYVCLHVHRIYSVVPDSVPVDLPLQLSIQTKNDTLVDLENATLKQEIQYDVSKAGKYI